MLRPFQLEALNAIEAAVASGLRRMRVTMAQGTGKSAVIGHAFARMLESGDANRALYLTASRLMAEQMRARLRSLEISGNGPLGDIHQILRLESATGSVNLDRSVSVGTISKFLALARAGTLPSFDLIIVDGLDGSVKWSSTALAKSLSRLDVTVIGFGSTLPPDTHTPGPTVFSYTYTEAAADRVLVDMSWLAATSREAAWPAFDLNDPVHRERSVFLCGVDEDRSAIRAITAGLREAGIQAVKVTQVASPEVASGDVFVPVLSPSSIRTPLADERVSQLLERRGVDVVPVMTEYCAVPALLASRLPVDVTHGIGGLLRRLQASAMVDLDNLDPPRFEELVADLLTRLGFVLTSSASTEMRDSASDFAAVFQDADGFGAATQYLIQAKRKRSSFRDVDELVRLVRQRGQSCRGMVVTNGYLTSVTENRLAIVEGEGVAVQVVDGPRLRSLVLRYPDLAAKHFSARAGR